MRQIENIKYLISKIGKDNIPENLSEVGLLRLKYQDAS